MQTRKFPYRLSTREDRPKDRRASEETRPASRPRREAEGERDRHHVSAQGGPRDSERPVSRARSRERERHPSRDHRGERPGDVRRSASLAVLGS